MRVEMYLNISLCSACSNGIGNCVYVFCKGRLLDIIEKDWIRRKRTFLVLIGKLLTFLLGQKDFWKDVRLLIGILYTENSVDIFWVLLQNIGQRVLKRIIRDQVFSPFSSCLRLGWCIALWMYVVRSVDVDVEGIRRVGRWWLMGFSWNHIRLGTQLRAQEYLEPQREKVA